MHRTAKGQIVLIFLLGKSFIEDNVSSLQGKYDLAQES